MIENVIDLYGDLVISKYFLHVFKTIPSTLTLELPLKGSSKNMQEVFENITSKRKYEIISEHWEISKNIEGDKTRDYVNYFFIQDLTNRFCVQIELMHEQLTLNFLYDRKDKDAKNWIDTSYQQVRKKFGIHQSPIFKVLSKRGGDFHVEKINVEKTEVNIKMNYNDDFDQINNIICKSLSSDESGLILLHGRPGTGKTTYIKHLLSEFGDKDFIFIPNDFVKELIQPDFISFLIAHKNSVLVIEDAEKVISSRDGNNKSSVVSTILQLTDGLFSDFLNIKIICTFNTNIKNIDHALLRKGRMIAFYEFEELSLDKTNDLLSSLELDSSSEKLTLADIYYAKNRDFKQSEKSIGF